MPLSSQPVLTARKRPRQARSAATVDAIFDATIQVLLLNGVGRLTTTRVATRAGVSVGTMYQYFPNKQALLCAVIDRYLGEVAEAVEAACEEHLGWPLDAASDALVSSYVAAKTRDVAASRALYAASSDLDVTDLVNRTFARLRTATEQLLASIPDACFVDVRGLAFSLVAAVTGATRVAFESRSDHDSFDGFRDRMLAMSRAFLHDASTVRIAADH